MMMHSTSGHKPGIENVLQNDSSGYKTRAWNRRKNGYRQAGEGKEKLQLRRTGNTGNPTVLIQANQIRTSAEGWARNLRASGSNTTL